jgi:uncharacterized membrane protein
MPLIMKFLHIVTAFWFIAGLLGRTLTMWQASKSTDIQLIRTLVQLAGYFERWMVIPGSLAVLGFGLATAWLQHWPLGSPAYWLLISTLLYLSIIPIIILIFVPRGKIFRKALETSVASETVTADLTAAFHDRVVHYAHIYELATTAVIILFMVLKPF